MKETGKFAFTLTSRQQTSVTVWFKTVWSYILAALGHGANKKLLHMTRRKIMNNQATTMELRPVPL